MNIEQAKQEICQTLQLYLQKDTQGRFVFPVRRQRPILLMGPPGIGKTAIMEQIAAQSQVALVSYTMTHHTRQSAIGLPQIAKRQYGGQTFTVTEYTLSEIVASVYETMERTGYCEGILFLDEINCVSETLTPAMLQFLQNKIFGNHKLPDGWVIVAAGNPPEYNKSVRPFDLVTLDRVRVLRIEADVDSFLQYAAQNALHGAVISYLKVHPQQFYFAEHTDEHMAYVTARGWENLSEVLLGYEQFGYSVTQEVVEEFLCQETVAREFYAYYQLYGRYGTDYAFDELLCGGESAENYSGRCALAAGGDLIERTMVVHLMLQTLEQTARAYRQLDRFAAVLHTEITGLREKNTLQQICQVRREELRETEYSEQNSERMLSEKTAIVLRLEEILNAARQAHIHTPEGQRQFAQTSFLQDAEKRAAMIDKMQTQLNAAIYFAEAAFGAGRELTLLLTGITNSAVIMDYIGRHGCPAYVEKSECLLEKSEVLRLQELCRTI